MDQIKLLVDISQKRLWDKNKKAYVLRALIKTVQVMLEMKRIDRNLLISVRMTDDKEIRRINNDFRSKDSATNVLSFQNVRWDNNEFDIINFEMLHITRNTILYQVSKNSYRKLNIADIKDDETIVNIGDIMLSYEKINAEAATQNKDCDEYLQFITTHGALHLMGYDHKEECEAKEMSRLENKIMQNLLDEKN